MERKSNMFDYTSGLAKCEFESNDRERYGSGCRILTASCGGHYENCKFYKTHRQFIQEQDKAIEVNRARGNCLTCKYDCAPCMLSKERKHG
jgi:hypothetical protein